MPIATVSHSPAQSLCPRRPTCSQDLQRLAADFADRPTQLYEILKATQGRGFDLLLILIALPFLTPIPLPGLSAPFGLIVALIGARLALGRNPWLPQALLAKELPPRFVAATLKAASRVVRLLEFLLRPRLGFLHGAFVFRRLAGGLLAVSGILLLLPLPIPFTNSLPALTILLVAAGSLEKDGVFFLSGCGVFCLSIAYFILLAFGGAHLADDLLHWFRGT